MLYEKEKLLIHRLIWGALLLVGIIVFIILRVVFSSANFAQEHFDLLLYVYIIIIFANIFIFAFFICSLTLSCRAYIYNDKEIIVYAGWYHHYIKVDGIKVDEHNTIMSFTPITMSCILEDGTDLKATITLTNRISLKINNQLYTIEKKKV